jgi:outer membrane protein OmpA-like peptidoglycan-associated protein
MISLGVTAQDSSLEKAMKKYDKYSYDTAAEELEEVSRKTTTVRRALAESYIKTQRYDLAEKEYELIMKNEDKVAADVLHYAEVLQVNKKYEQAQNTMGVYYELAPDDSRAKASHNNPAYFSELLVDKGQFTIKNLAINSAQEDFGTSYYKDKVVFASSREGSRAIRRKWNWNRLPFLDMYIADEGTGASLSELKPFNRAANKKYHEGPVAFNEKGDLMVFTRNNYEGTDKTGVRRLTLYEKMYVDGKWSAEKAFPFNSHEYSVGHATLDIDGKTMYFASDMRGGLGGVDIYRSERQADGTWTKPVNLGAPINTEGNEMFPFIHSDGILFFSSNGHLGLGGLDVFATPIDANGKAGMIKNLGTPVNGNRDDFALILNKNKSSGYFSSNRESGQGDDDIYYYDLLKPLAFGKKIEGLAKDKAGNIVGMASVSLLDINGNLLETMTTGEDGSFSFAADDKTEYRLKGAKADYFDGVGKANTLGDDAVVKTDLVLDKDPGISLFGLVKEKGTENNIEGVKITLLDNLGGPSTNYLTDEEGTFRNPLIGRKLTERISFNIKMEKEGYLPKTVTYNKVLDKPGQYDVHDELELSLTKLEVGMDIGAAIDIQPIYFDVNKFNIRPDAAIELQKIVEVMNAYPTMIIELGSHTDCRATEAYNMSLSDNRAKASASWIKKKITGPDRIYGKGFGESQLVNHCACDRTDKDNKICSEAEHQLNRRTEFRIVKM